MEECHKILNKNGTNINELFNKTTVENGIKIDKYSNKDIGNSLAILNIYISAHNVSYISLISIIISKSKIYANKKTVPFSNG